MWLLLQDVCGQNITKVKKAALQEDEISTLGEPELQVLAGGQEDDVRHTLPQLLPATHNICITKTLLSQKL